MVSFNDSVLFRYFFFQWLFRDANVTELYQRSAAIAHNRANRHHLLPYLRRWLALALVMFFLGIMLEQWDPLACLFFYTSAVICTCTVAKISLAWLLLGN